MARRRSQHGGELHGPHDSATASRHSASRAARAARIASATGVTASKTRSVSGPGPWNAVRSALIAHCSGVRGASADSAGVSVMVFIGVLGGRCGVAPGNLCLKFGAPLTPPVVRAGPAIRHVQPDPNASPSHRSSSGKPRAAPPDSFAIAALLPGETGQRGVDAREQIRVGIHAVQLVDRHVRRAQQRS
jgi:hypothetical protein